MDASAAQDLSQQPARDIRDARPRSSTSRAMAGIGRAAGRRCSRSDCGDPAAATLVFSYHEQVARIVELIDEIDPQAYDLCDRHADRTSPPRGWELADTRPPSTDHPRRIEDEDTVAIIAAALRGDDTPRRMDVIAGGDEVVAPRRVTRSGPPVGEPADEVAAADGDEDPLRAALEELQRVVARDDDTPGAVPTPLTRRAASTTDEIEPRLDESGDDESDQDHLTLW